MDNKRFEGDAAELSPIDYLAALREGSDDLDQPEFAPLRDELLADARLEQGVARVQAFDRRVRAALDDVEVPDELEARLLARLALAGGAPSIAASELAVTVADRSAPEPTASSRSERRWSAAWLIGIAAVLFVAFIAVWQSLKTGELQDDEIPLLAQGWQTDLTDAWERGALPAQFSLPYKLEQFVRDWQATVVQGHKAIAVRLFHPRQKAATLFILQGGGGSIAKASAPDVPQSTTGGWAVGYWQESGNLHVLLVQGGESDYRRLVRPAPGDLAAIPAHHRSNRLAA